MAAFTTVQAGDWSDPATWVDTATLEFGSGIVIVDELDGGFSRTGSDSGALGFGYAGNSRLSGTGACTASWVLAGLTASTAYRAGLTWTMYGPVYTDYDTAAGWQVFDSDGTTVLASGTVNMHTLPGAAGDVTDDGASWRVLTTGVTPTGTSLTVKLTGSNGKYLSFDAAFVDHTTGANAASPADGDTATINHAVAVDTNTTVGTSPSDDTTVVLQINSTLGVDAGVTFVVKGNTVQESTGNDVTLAAGAILEVDDTDAGSPTEYTWQKGNANNQRPIFTCNGSSGSPCEVRKNASGSRWSFTRSATSQGGDYTATWTTFRGVTLTGHAGDQFGASVSGTNFEDCFFDSAPVDILPGGLSPFVFTRCLWLNTPTGENCITANAGSIPASWAPVLTDCGFDAPVNMTTANLTATNVLFLSSVGWSSATTAAGSKAAGFSGCLNRLLINSNTRWGDWDESLYFCDPGGTYDGLGEYTAYTSTDLHWCGPSGTEAGVYAMTDCVFESSGSPGSGDIDYSPTSTNTTAFLRCLFLPDPEVDGGGASNGLGTMTTNNATGGSSTYDHCTYLGGLQGAIALAELGNGATGIVDSLRSNIFWNHPSLAGTGPFNKAVYQSTAPPGAAVDMVNPDQCGWNCIWNLNSATTKTNAKPYYDTNFTSAGNNAGQNDVHGDPGFVAPTRNLATWVASLEATWAAAPSGNYSANSSPSRTDYLAHGLYKLQVSTARPTHPDADSRYTLAAYLGYVRAGFSPTNVSLKNAGHDSITIGAVEGAWSPATTWLLRA